MHLTRLRYFVAIAEEQNVGRAAQRLHVAQPALSRQLRVLEGEVGAPLVERHARGVELTPAGVALLAHARRAIAEADAGLEAARAAAAPDVNTLRIGAPDWPQRAVQVADAVRRLNHRMPAVQVEYDPTSWLVHAGELLAGRIDVCFGVAMSADEYPRELQTTRLCDEPGAGALLPATHPLAQRASLRLADLRGIPTIVPPREVVPILHDQMVGTIRSAGYEPRVLPAPLSFAAAAQLVVAGAGWIITVLSIGDQPPPGTRVVPLDDAKVMLGFFVLARRDDDREPVRAFVSCVREAFGLAH